MQNKPLFDRSVAILVDSYNKGTLQHHNACGCGVGNLIAGHLGIQILDTGIDADGKPTYLKWGHSSPFWHSVHSLGIMQPVQNKILHDLGVEQIKATGYIPEETAALERAFERAYLENNGDVDGFVGLMNMIDVLTSIHETGIQAGDWGREQLMYRRQRKTLHERAIADNLHQNRVHGGFGFDFNIFGQIDSEAVRQRGRDARRETRQQGMERGNQVVWVGQQRRRDFADINPFDIAAFTQAINQSLQADLNRVVENSRDMIPVLTF